MYGTNGQRWDWTQSFTSFMNWKLHELKASWTESLTSEKSTSERGTSQQHFQFKSIRKTITLIRWKLLRSTTLGLNSKLYELKASRTSWADTFTRFMDLEFHERKYTSECDTSQQHWDWAHAEWAWAHGWALAHAQGRTWPASVIHINT